jgi:transcriptional regulator with XRE-family HTH domain
MAQKPHDPKALRALGDVIRRLRTQADMTQNELAFRVGVATRTVQRWEQPGEGTQPSAVDLLRVLDVFGIQVPSAPQAGTLSHELRLIHARLDELGRVEPADAAELALIAGSIDVPSADALAALVHELNEGHPSARRRAQMRQVADELAAAARNALRVAAALQARLEAVDSGR